MCVSQAKDFNVEQRKIGQSVCLMLYSWMLMQWGPRIYFRVALLSKPCKINCSEARVRQEGGVNSINLILLQTFALRHGEACHLVEHPGQQLRAVGPHPSAHLDPRVSIAKIASRSFSNIYYNCKNSISKSIMITMSQTSPLGTQWS